MVGAHHGQMTPRFPQARRVWRVTQILWAALSMAAWHGVLAQSPAKPEAASTNAWPPEIVLIQPIEFQVAAGSGQTGTVQAPQGTVMKLIGVHGDSADIAYRNLVTRVPAAATDLAARMETQKQGAEKKPPATRESPDTKTFFESSMSPEVFKAAGLDKLSRAELEVLDRWFLAVSSELLATGRAGAAPPSEKGAVPGRKTDAAPERVLLVKDFNGNKVLIQRSNGEKWLLRAKTWCRWSWKYEGRYVSLLFGPISSQLINDEGDTLGFWVDKKID
jgi:hypothetical protein